MSLTHFYNVKYFRTVDVLGVPLDRHVFNTFNTFDNSFILYPTGLNRKQNVSEQEKKNTTK